MPTPKKGARLGGSPAHQKLIIANLATSLFEHGRITTTEAKARVLRPVQLITKAKKGDLHNRRQGARATRAVRASGDPTVARAHGGGRAPTPATRAKTGAEERARGGHRAYESRRHRGLARAARGRRGPEGFPVKGNEDSIEVPRARRPVVRADRRRGLVRHRRGRRGRRVHQGRRRRRRTQASTLTRAARRGPYGADQGPSPLSWSRRAGSQLRPSVQRAPGLLDQPGRLGQRQPGRGARR